MSHLKERKEKDCLNCGAEIQGRFCQVCGQENIEPKESFWHLVTHFMYDVTHFDGKFFSTLKYLLFKPGFLSHEYLRGRRASYLHPIRMYVFTSAFFFLIFFSVGKEDDVVKIDNSPDTAAKIIKKLEKKRSRLVASVSNDSTLPSFAKTTMMEVVTRIDSDLALIRRDTTAKTKLKTIKEENALNMFGGKKNRDFKTLTAYDSAQNKMTAADRDGFIMRRFTRPNIHLKEKYNDDSQAIMKAIIEKFKHFFPQMLFVSLPLFALLLQMLYARRKRFFYVNHVVFTIHLYCGTFIIILAAMGVEALVKLVHIKESGWVNGLSALLILFFWYKSMRNFYEQKRGKTILKYAIVMFMSLILMALIFTLFFVFSAMAI